MFQLPVCIACYPSNISPANHSSKAAVKSSAEIIAQGVLTYYPPDSTSPSGQAIGIFGPGYTWGEAGAIWGALVDYWALTGDSQFNGQVQAALTAQSGLPTSTFFLPENQTSTEVYETILCRAVPS
jgi:mannan endo-1,6-alpha-mannosidase